MVKDLVRTKKSVTKFIELKTHLTAVGLKIQVILYKYNKLKDILHNNF